MTRRKKLGLAALIVASAATIYDAARIYYNGISPRAIYTEQLDNKKFIADVQISGFLGLCAIVAGTINYFRGGENRNNESNDFSLPRREKKEERFGSNRYLIN